MRTLYGRYAVPYFRKLYNERQWNFNSVATTDVWRIWSASAQGSPTVHVSLPVVAIRPESVATVDLAKQLVDELYQVTGTCAAEGKPAQQAYGDRRNLLLLQPAHQMMLALPWLHNYLMMLLALLVLTQQICQKRSKSMSWLLSQKVLADVADVQALLKLDFNRVIYLKGRTFFGFGARSTAENFGVDRWESCDHVWKQLASAMDQNLWLTKRRLCWYLAQGCIHKRYDLDLVREVAGEIRLLTRWSSLQTKTWKMLSRFLKVISWKISYRASLTSSPPALLS